MTKIIGLSAYYHDSAAVLVVNGNIISAAQEERFTRIKHDPSYPHKAIDYILNANNISLNDIDHVVFYDKPFSKFERLLETYISFAPRGFKQFCLAMPIWLREKLFLKKQILFELKKKCKTFNSNKLLFSEHHLSHAASAFYPSPYEDAIILTLDGVGEWASSSIAIGSKNKIKIIKEIHFPNSLGLLYSAFTFYSGFKVNSGEYKLMGLAPYGNPLYKEIITDNLIDIKDDGSFRLNQSFFDYSTGLKMINKKFENLFGKKARDPNLEPLTQFYMDIASSIQSVTEDIIIKITRKLSEEYKISNLCLAGGVALNCVANGKIYKDGNFKNMWIQPAAGDAGGALGAALLIWYDFLGKDRKINYKSDSMQGSYLGPSYNQDEIERELTKLNSIYKTYSDDKMLDITVDYLIEGKAIGWFQGKMEFGPRALGSRSILGDPRSSKMQKNLNLKVKFRESFRPFAPAILEEFVNDWFELDIPSPYMLLVDSVKKEKCLKMSDDEKKLFGIDKLNIKRSEIPAVTHVDYSARIQTVNNEFNKIFYELISKFYEKTNCPILINTSFNIRGEPIVNSIDDAYNCFLGTDLDLLIIGNSVLKKEDHKKLKNENYKNKYELD